jgi:alpha/beta superfamily hydrolase
MIAGTAKQLIQGAAGDIEIAIDAAKGDVLGVALVAHPHPLFGGTMDNKVAQTLAKTLNELGYITVRPNFRGVGKTAGVHDNGMAEQEDTLRVIDWMRAEFGAEQPLVLAGFSFGSYVISRVAETLKASGRAVQRMVMIGTAAGKWDVATVAEDTIVIHGELDDTIPLSAVMRWAEPQDLPVTVIAGADHFFHRRLHVLKRIILQQW